MNKPTIFNRLFFSTLIVFIALSLIGCPQSPKTEDEGDDGNDEALTSRLSVTCDALICSVDTSDSYIVNSDIAAHTCNMDDGNEINILTSESIYDYTYSASDVYTISCTVTDNNNVSDTTSITVSVGDVVANAGPDQTVNAGDLVYLDGSASTVGPGAGITYFWSKWSSVTNPITLDDRTAQHPSFIAPTESHSQTIQFVLSVSDGRGNSGPDYVSIFVNASSSNTNLQ